MKNEEFCYFNLIGAQKKRKPLGVKITKFLSFSFYLSHFTVSKKRAKKKNFRFPFVLCSLTHIFANGKEQN